MCVCLWGDRSSTQKGKADEVVEPAAPAPIATTPKEEEVEPSHQPPSDYQTAYPPLGCGSSASSSNSKPSNTKSSDSSSSSSSSSRVRSSSNSKPVNQPAQSQARSRASLEDAAIRTWAKFRVEGGPASSSKSRASPQQKQQQKPQQQQQQQQQQQPPSQPQQPQLPLGQSGVRSCANVQNHLEEQGHLWENGIFLSPLPPTLQVTRFSLCRGLLKDSSSRSQRQFPREAY